MDMRPQALLPELILLIGSLAVLLSGSFLPRRRLGLTRAIGLGVLAAAGIASGVALAGADQTVYDGTYTIDVATGAARLITVVGTALVLVLAGDELARQVRQAEIVCLLLLASLGTVVLAGAHDLLVLVAGFLLASVPLYGIVGLTPGPKAAEATMKTYLVGSLFGIVLMGGVTILYGVGGSTAYADLTDSLRGGPSGALIFASVAVLGGLMFKVGAAPGHYWVPDAAQGAGLYAAAYLTSVPKIGALVATYRLVLLLPPPAQAALLAGILAVLSMTLANLAAFAQQDTRRLLGWSTVSQAGYLLVPAAVAGRSDLALPALLVYLAGYVVTNLAAFAVLAALPDRRTLDDFAGLFRDRPWLAGAALVSLLGLVGTPPSAVFIGKLAVATAAWDGGVPWLTLAVLLNSVLSLFYYLRWLAPMLRRSSMGGPSSPWGVRGALTAAGLSVALGIFSAGPWRLFGGGS